MNVNKIKYNLYNSSVQNKNQNKVPSFEGTAPKVVRNISEAEFSDEIKHIMPPFIRGMKKLKDNMGETQNILINAVGTGLVAPIFIKWNPLSKTDEDTRTYSAWRQPVSAVLTIITQAGITIPVNRFIENLTNNGFYDEDYNKTLFQDKKYVAKIIKKQNPYLTKTQLNAKIDAHLKEQEATLLKMIRENKVIFSKLNEPSALMNKKNFIQLLTNTVEKKLKHEQEELTKCNDVKIKKKTIRGKYYQANNAEAKKIFTDINSKLITSSDANSVKAYVKTLKNKYSNSDPELKQILSEISQAYGNSKEDLKIAMTNKLTGILTDIETYGQCNDAAAVEKLVKDRVGVRIAQITDSINLLEKVKKAITENKTVAYIEHMIEGIVGKVPDGTHRLKDYKFGEQVAKQFKDQIKNNIQGHKQIVGLIVSFLMLPITCSLLNWSYPRFMDAVFPNLSSKKHPNEIKDLVDKANHKKAEVK